MQTLTLQITRPILATELRPGMAIADPVEGRPPGVVVEEIWSTMDGIQLWVRPPGAKRRRSLALESDETVAVFPSIDELDRLISALAVAHRGDMGEWAFTVRAELWFAPPGTDGAAAGWEIPDVGGDVWVTSSTDISAAEAAGHPSVDHSPRALRLARTFAGEPDEPTLDEAEAPGE